MAHGAFNNFNTLYEKASDFQVVYPHSNRSKYVIDITFHFLF